MKRLVLILGLILVTLICCSSSGLMAQDPNDPGEYDTLYFNPGGMRSPTGDTIYVWPDSFAQDVKILLNVWNDNDVHSFVGVFIDNCNGPPCNAHLDAAKNNISEHPKCFGGSRMEHIEQSAFKPGEWPPKFYVYAINYGEDPMPPGDGLLATFTFTVSDTGRICLDTTFVQPSNRTRFLISGGSAYTPVFESRTFVIANCAYSSGDPNYDGITNIVDVVCIVNYALRSGPPLCYEKSGDVNCDDLVSISDVVYLVNYLFKDGPAPGYCP